MESIEEYEKKKQVLENQKEQLNTRVQNAQAKYEKAVEEYNAIKKDDSVDAKQKRKAELKVEIEQKNVQRRKYAFQRITDRLEFVRPINEEDKAYRLRQYKEFPKLIEQNVPEDLHLCFHGCPIDAAKHIIEDGEISSSVDRIGSETSYDVSDQVSVTTKDTIMTTVAGYSGLTEMEYPAGCIFAITPKDEDEIRTSEGSMLIGNVNFKENPERLYSIITTPENIQRVSEWAEKTGIDLSKIHTYDDFIKSFDKDKKMDLLQSAVEATEQTRTGEINEQVKNIKEQQKENERDAEKAQ